MLGEAREGQALDFVFNGVDSKGGREGQGQRAPVSLSRAFHNPPSQKLPMGIR